MNWFSDSTLVATRALWKWKWTFLVPIATMLLPATIYSLRQPETFKATAVIQINEKNMGNASALPGSRDKTAYALVNQARDRVLTSENMKAVVKYLAPGADAEDMGVLQQMAKSIEFDRMGDNSFSISVIDIDPVIASQAVNAVCNRFLENEKARPVEEVRIKKEHAEKTLKRAKDGYEVAVAALNDFRDKNLGASTAAQANLQNELRNVREGIKSKDIRKNTWEAEFDKLSQELASGPGSRTSSGKRPDSAAEISAKGRLEKAIEKHNEATTALQGLRGTKTERNPEVIAAREIANGLEERVKAGESRLERARKAADREWSARTATDHAAKRALKEGRLRTLKADIARADREIAALGIREDMYIARLAKAPGVQDAMAPLEDAKNLAFKSVEEAQKTSSALDAKYDYISHAAPSESTPFAIIQPAEPPVDPHGPRRMKWIVLALAAGAGIGYGLMLLRRRFEKNNVTKVEDLAGMLPGALVVPVPRLAQAPMINPATMARDVVMGAWVLGCIGLAGLAVATHKGMFEGPDWLRAMIGV